MTYRRDEDLEFLGKLKPEDLDDLVYCLKYDKNGHSLHTEDLTLSAEYHANHNEYWQSVATEIQCIGADSFAQIWRNGHGVFYKEILTGVCDELRVGYDEHSGAEAIESRLLAKILGDALEKLTREELDDVTRKTGIAIDKNPSATTLRPLFQIGGFKSYHMLLAIVGAILKAFMNRGASHANDAALIKAAAVLSPVGWALNGILMMTDIDGPAYRATLPIVMLVSVLRRKHSSSRQADDITPSRP
ncbi:MAG: DUF3944 domain-containing protein [Azoarcus sp.]|jgi:uncharacterized protein YaaW (UPF0174 family)|nr:DUF3944 domain-containing protein [Azoarcus sp.]